MKTTIGCEKQPVPGWWNPKMTRNIYVSLLFALDFADPWDSVLNWQIVKEIKEPKVRNSIPLYLYLVKEFLVIVLLLWRDAKITATFIKKNFNWTWLTVQNFSDLSASEYGRMKADMMLEEPIFFIWIGKQQEKRVSSWVWLERLSFQSLHPSSNCATITPTRPQVLIISNTVTPYASMGTVFIQTTTRRDMLNCRKWCALIVDKECHSHRTEKTLKAKFEHKAYVPYLFDIFRLSISIGDRSIVLEYSV